jgi:hypothetical protein
VSRSRPSPALVVATIAVVVALGGTGYAAFNLPKNSVGTKQLKNGAVTSKKIANGAVTGAKVNLGSLGTVPNAAHAAAADNASQLGGQPASAYARSTPLTPTAATLLNGWTIADSTTPGYAKDQFGIVHLFGHVGHTPASQATVFTLPPGFRPAQYVDAPAAVEGGVAVLTIESNGDVHLLIAPHTFIDLEGVTFLAGG